jgi:hypothetical protein
MGIFRNADGHVSIGYFRQNKLNGKGLTLNEKDTLSNQFAFYSDQWNASSNSVDSTPGLLYLFGSDFAPVDYLFEQIDSLEEKLDKIKIEDACYKWLLQTNQVFSEEDKIFSIEKTRKDYKQVEKKQVEAAPANDSIKPSVPAAQPVDPTSSILPAAPANDSTKPSVPAAQPVQPVQPIPSTDPAAQPAAQHAIYLQSTRQYYVSDTSAFIKVCQLATQIGKLSLEQPPQAAVSSVEQEDNWVSVDRLADYCEQRKKAKAKRIELQTELQTQLSSKFPLFATLV